MNLINTSQAAEVLGVSERRVRALIADERLPAQRVGRDYVINEEDLALVADRKPGRPSKVSSSDTNEAGQTAATLAEENKSAKPRKMAGKKARAIGMKKGAKNEQRRT